MGFCTTVVINNDLLSVIEGDPEFGRKVASGCRHVAAYSKPMSICPGVQVIETHHASVYVPILVGNCTGHVIRDGCIGAELGPGADLELAFLKELAWKKGYYLRKKKANQ